MYNMQDVYNVETTSCHYVMAMYNLFSHADVVIHRDTGHLFTMRQDIVPPNLVKSRIREIGCYNDHNDIKFDRHFGSAAAYGPVKLQSDWKSINPDLTVSRLHRGPGKNPLPEPKKSHGTEFSADPSTMQNDFLKKNCITSSAEWQANPPCLNLFI